MPKIMEPGLIPSILRTCLRGEADIYGGAPQVGNVFTAMSLVPDSVRMLSRLSAVQYLEASEVVNPAF